MKFARPALAHAIENKAEAAYRRGDLFDKRRKLTGGMGCLLRSAQGWKGRGVQTKGVGESQALEDRFKASPARFRFVMTCSVMHRFVAPHAVAECNIDRPGRAGRR